MALDLQPVAKKLDLQPVAAPLDLQPAQPPAKKLDLQPAAAAPPPVKSELKELLPDEPGRHYAAILPVSNIPGQPGSTQLAIPGMIRSAIHNFEIPGRITAGQQIPQEELEGAARDIALSTALGFGPRTFNSKVAKAAPEAAAIPGAGPIPKGPPIHEAPIPATVVMPTEAPPTMVDQAKNAAASLRNIFSPTSAGPNAKLAETSVRDFEGTGLRNRVQAEKSLEDFTAQGQAIAQDPLQSSQFFDYVQGRTKGVKLADESMQPFADEVRRIAKDTENQLRELPQTEDMHYIEDYFPQAWKDPAKAQEFASQFVGKQGGTGFTKARKYPTISDGLQAGLQLADPNPASAMLSYVTNAQKAISASKIFNEGRELGQIKFGAPGGKVPEGWVPLKGRLATKPAVTLPDGTYVPGKQAYAPADYALIYNNYLSSGFEKTVGADAYKAIRGVKNAQTMLQLGFSTHHLATIMAQSMAGDVQRALGGLIKGDLKQAGSAVKDLATTPLLPFSSKYRAGAKLRQQYEGIKDYGPEMEQRAKLFASSGGRIGEDPLYRGSQEKSLVQSMKEGTLLGEIKDGAQAVAKNPLGTPMQAVKTAGRLADTVAAPLFNRYIPNIKLGAFDAQMGDWLKAHPDAAPEEIRVAAKGIMDLMDERFGEIADSNVFWNRTTKQVLGTLLRAPNWDLGLIRQSFGAVADAGKLGLQAAKRQGIDKSLLNRPTYLLSYALLNAAFNTAMTKLKTGHWPDDVTDLVAYETGGITPYGNDERALFPGHPRELLQMAPKPGEGLTSGLAELAGHKWSSLVSAGQEAYNNENFMGDPIGGPAARAWHFLGDPFTPLQITQMTQGAPVGSNLTAAERLMNIRPAPASISDPVQMENFAKARQRKAEQKKVRHENKQKARYPDAGMGW